ncbi:uncharacterized protein LOC129573357 [Sitodiplosis mosellana]|uniref:uncharacterized protein LOC129573357 n=1 Tax=Sitodiplosis mosellana TaxID=263140 RepID=UPI0024451106|nr:uncharacterized protein LOC129573357 [Sitodiplosis mosellana]
MKIENILIEHFPRLKCANFFILFDTNFDDVSSVRVHLRPTEIFVRFENDHSTTIDLQSLAVRIQINSLSLLIAKENLISFRINIASSFREEILPMQSTMNAASAMKRLSLNVEPDTEFSIVCDNCSGPLSKSLHFRRILELPSEQMDSNEWFCHKPEATTCNGQHQPVFSATSLMPAEDDLLFGNYFALIHRTHIQNIHVNSQQRMIHCKRCLSHIGESVGDSTLKFWNGNIKIIRTNVDTPERLFTDSNSLFHNFLVIVDRVSYDYQMLGRQTLKLLFEARSSKGTTFLFIQTMARNLEIYQMDKHTNTTTDRATMTRVDGIKCLFLCEENTDRTLVEFWQKDVNVVSAHISIGMLDATVEHLHLLSKYVPEQFRMNNGFCLSYLSYGINS